MIIAVSREQARAQILEMKLQEVGSDSLLKDYNQLHSNKDRAYTQWYGRSRAFVRKLGEERSVAVDDASKMRACQNLLYDPILSSQVIVNKAATERKLALQGFLKDARSQVEQSREQEKVRVVLNSRIINRLCVLQLATDASELIKHYKSLLGVGRVNKQRQG